MEETVNQPGEETGEQCDRVLLTVTDFQGQLIRLTTRQWHHIVDAHPDMLNMEGALRATLESPDEVRRSRDDPNTVKLYYMCHAEPLSSKMVCVVVKSLEEDAFILTAYQTYRIIEGELLWRKES